MIERDYKGWARFTDLAKRELKANRILPINKTVWAYDGGQPAHGITIEYNGWKDWFDRSWLQPLEFEIYLNEIEQL